MEELTAITAMPLCKHLLCPVSADLIIAYTAILLTSIFQVITAQHSTAQHSTAQHSTAQHSTGLQINCLCHTSLHLSHTCQQQLARNSSTITSRLIVSPPAESPEPPQLCCCLKCPCSAYATCLEPPCWPPGLSGWQQLQPGNPPKSHLPARRALDQVIC